MNHGANHLDIPECTEGLAPVALFVCAPWLAYGSERNSVIPRFFFLRVYVCSGARRVQQLLKGSTVTISE